MWVSGWVGFESVCEKEGNREREGQRQGGGERERVGGREGGATGAPPTPAGSQDSRDTCHDLPHLPCQPLPSPSFPVSLCPFALVQIPLHSVIRDASDRGAPVVHSLPDSDAAAAYKSVAERVWEKLQAGGTARPPPKITIE